MRILLVGAGGVGTAFARIAARRPFAELVVADYDLGRAQRAAGPDAVAVQLDARDEGRVEALLTEHSCDVLMNATDPRFVMPLYRAALAAGTHYADMAMSLSQPDKDEPYARTGVKLGDEQFELADAWAQRGQLALVGIGVEPGLSDIFARHAADTMFSEIDEIGVRDGANLAVAGYDFAPTFSIWTTIEECLNPPVIWERDRGWFTTAPFSEPEVFSFPAGIGPVECVNVEHEEVLLIPRWVRARRVTFKYGLGAEFIAVLQTLHKLGLDSTAPVRTGGVTVSPRDVVAACLPDPAGLGSKMTGLTCAGTWVTGTGTDGAPREVYLHHVVDNAWTMAEYGSQAVVWQTAVNPVVALELLDSGAWSGTGVLGPEALPAQPFLDLLNDYGSPWACEERTPAAKLANKDFQRRIRGGRIPQFHRRPVDGHSLRQAGRADRPEHRRGVCHGPGVRRGGSGRRVHLGGGRLRRLAGRDPGRAQPGAAEDRRRAGVAGG
jgi:saccharopine dehydrogenase-like NADP-dependent oxidoreductase